MGGVLDYGEYDACGLAERVRSGDVTPVELLEEAISRADRINPKLNAIIARLDELARRDAREVGREAPFAGVPFLLKDLLHAYSGAPLASGSASLRDYIPESDSEIVRRFRGAGLVIFGKTNLPEFGLVATTEPLAFGPTRNPWDPSRSSGGSSGGSAAAVAAGIVPMASATDGGGSIRIPAAWCGLFGLKPGRGRSFGAPYFGEVWEGAVVDGVLTRSVRDSAAALDVITGAAPGDPYLAATPAAPFAAAARTPPRPLRIGFATRSPVETPVDPECVRAVDETIVLLESLGHRCEEAAPAVHGLEVARTYIVLVLGDVAADLRLIARTFGREAARRVEPATRALGIIGERLSSAEYVATRRNWNTFARAVAAFHAEYDLFLTPTTAMPPPPIGDLMPSRIENVALRAVNAIGAGTLLRSTGILEKMVLENLAPVPFTQLANLTGQPAMSVPLHWTPDDLPVGVHFSGPLGAESLLLSLAAQLEEARPWARRRPG